MIQNYKIRLAVADDLPKMCEIYNQAIAFRKCTCHTELLTVEERKGWFEEHENPQYPLFVLTVDDVVTSYAYLSAYRPNRKAVGHVAEISYYIDFAYHKQGIGSILLDFMIGEAKKRNINVLLAILLSGNLGSIKLLEKYNFELWGKLPQIVNIDECHYDHLYYGKNLI